VTVTYTPAANSTPNAPTLISPASGSTAASATPQLKMSATDPNSDALKYKVIVYTTSANSGGNCTGSVQETGTQASSGVGWDNGTTAYASGATATYTVQTALTRGSSYCWQAQAIDPGGTNTYGSLSSPSTFTINSVPVAPTLSTPTAGSSGVSLSPAFTLSSTDSNSDYLEYRIYVYQSDCSTAVGSSPFAQASSQTGWTGQNANSSQAYASGTTATYTYQGSLSSLTTYCWKADVVDPAGSNTYSSASSTQTFTTTAVAAASAPTLLAPSSGATSSYTSPVFQFRSSVSTNQYLQYKILLYNSDCSTGPQTFDQTASQYGWAQQNQAGGTAYTGSSTLASSAIAFFGGASLSTNTTYCWKAAAIDPAGSNIFSSFSATQLFTTGSSAGAAASLGPGATINGGTWIR
jgi:hypothetical protein